MGNFYETMKRQEIIPIIWCSWSKLGTSLSFPVIDCRSFIYINCQGTVQHTYKTYTKSTTKMDNEHNLSINLSSIKIQEALKISHTSLLYFLFLCDDWREWKFLPSQEEFSIILNIILVLW